MDKITKLFDQYRNGFNDKSAAQLAQLVEMPLLINHQGNKVLLTHKTELIAMLNKLLNAYIDSNFQSAYYKIKSVYELSKTDSIVSLHWHPKTQTI